MMHNRFHHNPYTEKSNVNIYYVYMQYNISLHRPSLCEYYVCVCVYHIASTLRSYAVVDDLFSSAASAASREPQFVTNNNNNNNNHNNNNKNNDSKRKISHTCTHRHIHTLYIQAICLMNAWQKRSY